MSNITVTTSQTLEEVIALGLNDGENITINSGVVVTCTQKPSKLIGDTINQGELILDGENISSGNLLNFIGEGGNSSNKKKLIVNGQGILTVKGGWYSIGTTNGTDSQVIDISSATGSDLWNGDQHVSVLPMIQIETGRRLTFDNPSSVATDILVAGDWVYLSSDRKVMGKIKEVTDTYLIVWYLTGTVADNDEIQVRKIVDNKGPDLQVAWTADMVGADVKESGIYHEFTNCRTNATSHISAYNHGVGGFVFEHTFGTTSLTLGSSSGDTGGFVVPSGCDIQVPNVMIASAIVTDYTAGNCTNNSKMSDLYKLECSAGGTIELDTVNIANAYFADASAYRFTAQYVGAQFNLGSSLSANTTTYTHCAICQATEYAPSSAANIFNGVDAVNGIEIKFCSVVQSIINKSSIGVTTSFDVVVEDCIISAPGTSNTTPSSNNLYNFMNSKNIIVKNNIAVGCTESAIGYLFYFSGCTDIQAEMLMISCTQDGSQQTREMSCFSIFNTNGIVKGIEYINSINGIGLTGDHLIKSTDCINLKIRCMGMIDDKVDFGTTDAEFVIQLNGICNNVDVARIWKTRGISKEFITIPVSAKNTTVTNCSGNYASELQPSGNSTRFKGIHGGSGTPGGSTGWEDAYSASYGNSFYDGFQSDTTGTIACLMITPSNITNETTIIAGNPLFYKDGDLNMVAGDIIEFEQSYFTLGHTGFSGKYTASTATSGWFADEWSKVTLEFQYDIGAGWNGTWLNTRTPANLTGITVDPAIGVKLKHRFTATGTQNDMSMLLIDTTTSLTAQKENMYPIDQNTVIVRVKCLTPNGDVVAGVRVYLKTNSKIILNGITNEFGIIEDTEYVYTADEAVSGWGRKSSSAPYYKQGVLNGTITSNGLLLTAVMISDD